MARERYLYNKAANQKESRRSWPDGIACSFGSKKCSDMLPGSFWLVPSDVSLDSKDRICRFVSLAWLPFASLFYAGEDLAALALYMLETLFKDKLDSGANAGQRLVRCVHSDSSID